MNVILIQSYLLILPNNIVECFHLYPSIQTVHANQLNITLIMTTPYDLLNLQGNKQN
jgi:hypothetical protein